MLTPPLPRQQGIFLLEALIAILIFSLGILAMIALQGTAITAQSDAMYRTEAANVVSKMIGQINLGVDRTNSATLQTSLNNYIHLPTGNCTATTCTFTGTASADTAVAEFTTAAQRLPGATGTMQQVAVGANNTVTITVGWRINANAPYRWHQIIAYVY